MPTGKPTRRTTQPFAETSLTEVPRVDRNTLEVHHSFALRIIEAAPVYTLAIKVRAGRQIDVDPRDGNLV